MPMKVIALVSSKGGSGKITLAACLAAELSNRGIDVALLDVYPQQTLSDRHRADGPLQKLELGSANGAAVDPTLQALTRRHELVSVDSPGFHNRDTLAVLRWADVALVPFGPSPADALGAVKTLRVLTEVNSTQERRKRPVRVLTALNRADKTAMTAHIRNRLPAQVQPYSTHLSADGLLYAEAMLAGSAPCWMGSSGKSTQGLRQKRFPVSQMR
jgi:chromosome partitioning protein